MNYEQIKAVADKVVTALLPYCERCEIAGSVRRKKSDCKDIEVCIVPRGRDLPELARVVRGWDRVKGDIKGRYTQRRLPEGVVLDLFIATRDNWGLIYAIRTGSAEFSHNVLARGWRKRGYTSQGGVLYPYTREAKGESVVDILDFSNPLYIREEQELFEFIGIPFVEPEARL